MTQHFAVTPGHLTAWLRAWCALMGVQFHAEEE